MGVASAGGPIASTSERSAFRLAARIAGSRWKATVSTTCPLKDNISGLAERILSRDVTISTECDWTLRP
jgi:hypothetical protein